jgi:hypothetical protein
MRGDCMSFNIGYVAGGVIDKIRELPYPHFGRKTKPYIIGREIPIAVGQPDYSETYTVTGGSAEWLSIAVACSEYGQGDYWELSINGELVCEKIYTKDLPESISLGNTFGIVFPCPEGTVFKFDYYNMSNTEKKVWYNLRFLK